MVLTFGGHFTSVLGLKYVHLLILAISLRVMIFLCAGVEVGFNLSFMSSLEFSRAC